MTNKLSFSKMSLFQLMNWLEDNNYNEETYLPIVDEIDDMGYNPFQDMPDNYEGTLEDWEKSLDEVESYLKSVYIRACSTVWSTRMQALFNFTLSLAVFLCNGFFGSWCWNNLVANSSIPELSPINVMGIMIFMAFVNPLKLMEFLEYEWFVDKKPEEKANNLTRYNVSKAFIVLFLAVEVYIITFFK